MLNRRCQWRAACFEAVRHFDVVMGAGLGLSAVVGPCYLASIVKEGYTRCLLICNLTRAFCANRIHLSFVSVHADRASSRLYFRNHCRDCLSSRAHARRQKILEALISSINITVARATLLEANRTRHTSPPSCLSALAT
jgi:hypothetical protein